MNTLIMSFIYEKNSFVVRVGTNCTDLIALYIDMEKKRGKNIGQNITYTKLDQLKNEKK